MVDCFDACQGWEILTTDALKPEERAFSPPKLTSTASSASLSVHDPLYFELDDDDEEDTMTSETTIQTCPGSPFMQVLQQRLQNLLEQPHQTNLILTAIFSILLRVRSQISASLADYV